MADHRSHVTDGVCSIVSVIHLDVDFGSLPVEDICARLQMSELVGLGLRLHISFLLVSRSKALIDELQT